MLKSVLSILLISFSFLKSCDAPAKIDMPSVDAPPKSDMMCGLNFVAPPRAFTNNPMDAVNAVNADWIAVIPYAFTRVGEPKVYFNTERQWWGERDIGVRETIELAQASNINVLLKPQVYIPRSWVGELDFDTDADWAKWETDYRSYIMTFVQIAKEYDVPAFCIGTEFKIGVVKREAFWRKLIKDIRTVYDGKLVYASNWDEFKLVPFWDALDIVGINSYFPLTDDKTPDVEKLKKAWLPHKKAIRNFYNKTKKPIVFTEYGYLSVDGCASKTWELEAKVNQLPINAQAQANAIQALLETFWDEPYWHGGFLWKWFPNMAGGEGYNERDYTPQGKIGHDVLKRCYGKAMTSKQE